MAFEMLDPDDPAFRHKTWDVIEKILKQREEERGAIAGFDPSQEDKPGRVYSKFPWEEMVDDFEKPATCKQENWKHKNHLKYELGNGCAVLTFCSGVQNTFDPAMLDALQDAIMDLRERSDVRAIFFKAEGKMFSTGWDPKYLMSESTLTEKQIEATHMQFAKILYFLQSLPQFTVALVQGSAMGAGVGFICACDLIVSVKAAHFAMSETKLGVVATTSIPYILRRIPFKANARQLLLAAANASAETAKDYGIVDTVVENEEGLKTEADSLCAKLTQCAPGALAMTKKVVLNTVGAPPSTFMLDYVGDSIQKVRRSDEAHSGIEAIQNKKKPPWASAPIKMP